MKKRHIILLNSFFLITNPALGMEADDRIDIRDRGVILEGWGAKEGVMRSTVTRKVDEGVRIINEKCQPLTTALVNRYIQNVQDYIISLLENPLHLQQNTIFNALFCLQAPYQLGFVSTGIISNERLKILLAQIWHIINYQSYLLNNSSNLPIDRLRDQLRTHLVKNLADCVTEETRNVDNKLLVCGQGQKTGLVTTLSGHMGIVIQVVDQPVTLQGFVDYELTRRQNFFLNISNNRRGAYHQTVNLLIETYYEANRAFSGSIPDIETVMKAFINFIDEESYLSPTEYDQLKNQFSNIRPSSSGSSYQRAQPTSSASASSYNHPMQRAIERNRNRVRKNKD